MIREKDPMKISYGSRLSWSCMLLEILFEWKKVSTV